MKLNAKPIPLISLMATVLVGLMVVLGILPALSRLQTTRDRLNQTRAAIASLKQQQQNIDAVTQTYARLTEQSNALNSAFLSDQQLIVFFNQLDELGDTYQLTNYEKRLDPAGSQKFQLVGLHLTFTSTSGVALKFIEQLQSLTTLVVPQTVVLTSTTGIEQVNVTIDAFVPWRTQI